MYGFVDWVGGNVGNMSFGDYCSSPRKEKNSKPPTGENLVPHELITRVNPNRGKQGGIPEYRIFPYARPIPNATLVTSLKWPLCVTQYFFIARSDYLILL